MNAHWKSRLTIAAAAALLLAAVVASTQRASAQREGARAHYTVVMTEGHNLLVTDDTANKLYFYTIDKDKPIGSPLKLRASINLTDVGRDEIRITPHNLEKAEK
jgi:hypothetical protein